MSLGVILLLIGTGFSWVYYKARGDREVMEDVERHFASLPSNSARKASKGKRPPPASAAVMSQETQKTQKPASNATGTKEKARGSGKQRPARRPSPKKKAIDKVAPATYVVDAKLFAEALKNPERYAKEITVTMAEKDGKSSGFKISDIKRKSRFFALGLRRGDVLKAVNGFKLESLDHVFVALAALELNTMFRLDILRKGKPISLYYSLE